MKLVLAILVFFGFSLTSCDEAKNTETSEKIEVKSDDLDLGTKKDAEKAVKYLTTAEFKEKVWDYQSEPERWKFKGDLPVVIDFYATWCRPCKMIAPILEELAVKYEGKVLFYKVDTDKEKELSRTFQIRSIPSILFVPQNGEPKFSKGAMQKEDYIKIIEQEVLGNK
jgi:thioredoxin